MHWNISIDNFPKKSPMTYFIKSLSIASRNATYTEVEEFLKYSISLNILFGYHMTCKLLSPSRYLFNTFNCTTGTNKIFVSNCIILCYIDVFLKLKKYLMK